MSGDSLQPSGPVGNGSPEDANCGVNGDQAAHQAANCVAEWHSQQVQWLRSFVFGILRDNDLVDDVLQTVFRKALEQAASIEPHAVRAWLTKVAHNEALLLKRKQGVNSRAMQKMRAGQSEGSSTTLPIDDLIQREAAARVMAALLQLPPEQRFVVERRIQGESTFAEIAAELQVPLGTVLTRMRLALGKLKLALGDEPGD